MRKPKFDFGDLVVPTVKAFTAGVFDWNDQETIIAVVVYCQDDKTVVVHKGCVSTTHYHTKYWTRP